MTRYRNTWLDVLKNWTIIIILSLVFCVAILNKRISILWWTNNHCLDKVILVCISATPSYEIPMREIKHKYRNMLLYCVAIMVLSFVGGDTFYSFTSSKFKINCTYWCHEENIRGAFPRNYHRVSFFMFDEQRLKLDVDGDSNLFTTQFYFYVFIWVDNITKLNFIVLQN